ncbi:YceI family protein [Pontibacter sp. 172403-2]|uniref:YceI family protein n=1 Tax=Pontibacter rufus TaxID=2791028 RepID=UPI0018AFC4C5|nr:YceI family protein [Pontibacter sp. 172403-2]MBF9251696.1 YceI family protein [Pontibacter sp. 172403-2]
MRYSARHLFYSFNSALLLFIASACDTTIKTDEAVISDAVFEKKITMAPLDTLTIDTAKSEITWIGAKMTGRHNGRFYIQSGKLYRNKKLLAGGTIVLNMAALRSDDKGIDAETNAKLTRQLRSADFFDVEHYPAAVFELTAVVPIDSSGQQAATRKYDERHVGNPTHRITGNLSIKGQTKSVSFPARVTFEDNLLHARANFNLDRTKWGLVYRSDESLGNQTIYPEVNIGLNIVATP